MKDDARKGAEDTSSKDGHFSVCDKSHSGIVIALDPEVNCSAKLFQHGRWWSLRSRLPGLSLGYGATSELSARLIQEQTQRPTG